ncbi:MAG: hypothetical protein HND51_14485 [Chloroflexi bacterium]|nr:hypothetical protein [Chloroflexota bacterium]
MRKHKWLVLSLFVFTLAGLARLIPGLRTIDDAFITFRYARNLLAGEGFAYNTGESVLGTTTPLYTLIMAALGSLTGGVKAPFPTIALIFNSLADGLTAVLLLRIGRQLQSFWAGLGTSLVWTILPFSVTFAIGGLETSLYVLLLVATLAAYLEKRYTLTGIIAAAVLLTRPDALILILPLGFDRLFFDPKRRGVALHRHELLGFFLPTILWFGFAAFYFGTPLPHSITAKQGAYLLEPIEALIRLLQHYATPFMGNLTFGNLWNGVGILFYLFFSVIGILYLIRKQGATWPFLLFPWFYFAAFAIANPLIFRWYLTPPLPFYIFAILTGLNKILRDVFQTEEYPPPKRKLLYRLSTLVIAFVPLLLVIRAWDWQPDHGLQRPAPNMAWYLLELRYREAAEIVSLDAANIDNVPTLAAGDVGVLGFYTGLPILDTVGLNSPQTLDYYPINPGFIAGAAYAVAPELIFDEQPEYIVILEIYGREGLLKDPRFDEQYSLLHKIETNIYDSDGMLIYKRLP